MSSEDSLIVSQNGAPPPRHTRPKFFNLRRKTSYGSTKGTQSSLRSYQQSGRFQESYAPEIPSPTPTNERGRQLGEQPKKSSCKAKLASFCFTLTVFLFVLVSAALSKVCFANIAAQLNANSSVGSGSEGGKRRSIAFVQLVLVLCVPQVVTILKTLFLGILGKTAKRFPWPTWKALLKVCVSLVPQECCIYVHICACTLFCACTMRPLASPRISRINDCSDFGACVECACRSIDHWCLYVYPVLHVCLVGSVGCYSRSSLPFGLHNVCGHTSWPCRHNLTHPWCFCIHCSQFDVQ